MFDTRGDTRLIEGNRQRQHRHAGLQGIEHGIQPGMGDDRRGSGQCRALGREVGDPMRALLAQPRRLRGIQPAAMGNQQLYAERLAGAGDSAQQGIAMSLQGTQRGEDERLRRVDRQVQLGFVFQRTPQRPDSMKIRRELAARKVEAGHRLADLQRRRQAFAQGRARRQAERLAIVLDHIGMGPHQAVVDTATVQVELLAPVGRPVAPGHHRQGHQRLAVERQGTGDGYERQIEMFGHQRPGRLHLVGQYGIDLQRTQHARRLATEQCGTRRHVGDDPADAERPRLRGAADHRSQAARRTGLGADGGKSGRRQRQQLGDIGLLDESHSVASLDQLPGDRFEGAQMAEKGRSNCREMGHLAAPPGFSCRRLAAAAPAAGRPGRPNLYRSRRCAAARSALRSA